MVMDGDVNMVEDVKSILFIEVRLGEKIRTTLKTQADSQSYVGHIAKT